MLSSLLTQQLQLSRHELLLLFARISLSLSLPEKSFLLSSSHALTCNELLLSLTLPRIDHSLSLFHSHFYFIAGDGLGGTLPKMDLTLQTLKALRGKLRIKKFSFNFTSDPQLDFHKLMTMYLI